MKKICFSLLLSMFLLVGCGGENPSTSNSSSEEKKYVVLNYPKETIEQLIYGRIMKESKDIYPFESVYMIEIQTYIESFKYLTKNSISLYECIDQNENFCIVNFLIDGDGVVTKKDRGWGMSAHGDFWYGFNNHLYLLSLWCSNEPVVYKDNNIYTIPEAYDKGIINVDYINAHSRHAVKDDPDSFYLLSFPDQAYIS